MFLYFNPLIHLPSLYSWGLVNREFLALLAMAPFGSFEDLKFTEHVESYFNFYVTSRRVVICAFVYTALLEPIEDRVLRHFSSLH